MLKRIQIMVVAFGVMLGTGACATFGDGGPEAAAERAESTTMLKVENDNWQDITVYVMRGTSRFRLGTVTGLTEETFEVPTTLLSDAQDLKLMADPIGSHRSRAYVTDPIPFAKGNTVVWKLGTDLRFSNHSVR